MENVKTLAHFSIAPCMHQWFASAFCTYHYIVWKLRKHKYQRKHPKCPGMAQAALNRVLQTSFYKDGTRGKYTKSTIKLTITYKSSFITSLCPSWATTIKFSRPPDHCSILQWCDIVFILCNCNDTIQVIRSCLFCEINVQSWYDVKGWGWKSDFEPATF